MDIDSHCFDVALQRLAGDQKLFRELTLYFTEDAPVLLQALRKGLAAGNAESVRRAAHSLRGLAANFDAEQAVTIAAFIEQMACEGNLRSVSAALLNLEVKIRSLSSA